MIEVEHTDVLALAEAIGHDPSEVKRHLDSGRMTKAGLISAFNYQRES